MAFWAPEGPFGSDLLQFAVYLQYLNEILAVHLRPRGMDEPSPVVPREKKWIPAIQQVFFQEMFHIGLVRFFFFLPDIFNQITLLLVRSTF